MNKRTSLKGLTEEEKQERKKQQLREAQRRYYESHKEYYKNYNRERPFYKIKYNELKERNEKAVELLECLIELNGTITPKGLEKVVSILKGE